jgi:hypothetical protein
MFLIRLKEAAINVAIEFFFQFVYLGSMQSTMFKGQNDDGHFKT